MKQNNLTRLFIISILFLVLNYLSKIILNLDEILVSSLSERMSTKQLSNYLIFKNKWQWLSNLILPIILILKITIIASILDIGCFFFSKKIKYKNLFKIVIKAEFIFLLVIIFKTVYFYFFKESYTLEELQSFYPLSALNIVGFQNLETWFIYPFQVLNLFEVAYWFILAYLLGKEINDTTEKGFSIVASSYGVSLLIWVVIVMFLTLNIS